MDASKNCDVIIVFAFKYLVAGVALAYMELLVVFLAVDFGAARGLRALAFLAYFPGAAAMIRKQT